MKSLVTTTRKEWLMALDSAKWPTVSKLSELERQSQEATNAALEELGEAKRAIADYIENFLYMKTVITNVKVSDGIKLFGLQVVKPRHEERVSHLFQYGHHMGFFVKRMYEPSIVSESVFCGMGGPINIGIDVGHLKEALSGIDSEEMSSLRLLSQEIEVEIDRMQMLPGIEAINVDSEFYAKVIWWGKCKT